MFDEIAPTYDLLNRILSFWLDIYWRRKSVRSLMEKSGGRFLDIAAGTGDLSLAALRAQPRHVIALDFALQPLTIARRKIQKLNKPSDTSSIIDLLIGDAAILPFKENSFDAVLVGFGVRNFLDKTRALREMHRVLQSGGVVCILELSRPHIPVIAQLFRWYFHHVVPLVGKIFSGHGGAYRYLPESVNNFPEPNAFVSLMREAGFHNTHHQPLTLGVASIYTGRKS